MKLTKNELIQLVNGRKICIEGKSIDVQEKLFTLGWKLFDGSQNVNENIPFIFIYESFFSYTYDIHKFLNHKFKLMSIDEFLSIEIID